MILNAGSGGGSSGGLKVIACGSFTGGSGSQFTLPAPAQYVLIGDYAAGSMGGAPYCENVAILAPGMITRGLTPEVTFESDAVTLTMGSSMSSTATRNYIAFG